MEVFQPEWEGRLFGRKEVQDLELAWAAGFFDGEGCITWDKRVAQGRPAISIAQVDRRVLDRFKEAVGCGIVRGPYSYNTRKGFENSQPQFKFSATSISDIRQIVGLISPYLSEIKLDQFNKTMMRAAHLVPRNSLSNIEIEDIRLEYKKGDYSYSSLARLFNRDPSTIRRLLKGETYGDV